jgi:hypothetical protein
MALDLSNIVGGSGLMSIGPYVAAGGAGSLVDVGETSAPFELSPELENTDFEGERTGGIVKSLASKTGFVLKCPLMQAEALLMMMALGQPAANATAGTGENYTARVGVRVEQYHQATIVTPGVIGTGGTPAVRTYTFWKLQAIACEPITIGRLVLQQWIASFRALPDASVTTADKFFKWVDVGAA